MSEWSMCTSAMADRRSSETSKRIIVTGVRILVGRHLRIRPSRTDQAAEWRAPVRSEQHGRLQLSEGGRRSLNSMACKPLLAVKWEEGWEKPVARWREELGITPVTTGPQSWHALPGMQDWETA